MPLSRLYRKMRKHHKRGKAQRRHKKFTGSKGLEKVYNYTFKTVPSWLQSTGTAQGSGATSNTMNVINTTYTGNVITLKDFTRDPTTGTQFTYPSPTGFTYWGDIGCGLSFQVLDLQNFNAFAEIYDQYKVNSIKMTVTYLANNNPITGLAGLPVIYAVADYDNATIPTNAQSVRGKQGSVMWRFGNKMKNSYSMTIKPKVRVALTDNNSAQSTNPGLEWKAGWLDCGNQNFELYGLKMWLENLYLMGGTANQAFQFDFAWNISFRGAQQVF